MKCMLWEFHDFKSGNTICKWGDNRFGGGNNEWNHNMKILGREYYTNRGYRSCHDLWQWIYISWNIQCARLNSQFTSSIWKCKYYCHLDYNSILRYYHILTSNLDPIQTNCLGKHKCKTCCLPCAERVELIKFGLYQMSRLKCSGFLATCGCS